MSYIIDVLPFCKKSIDKACKRNSILRKILENKMREIIINPLRYKPLKYDLAGERRVHILKSFVLKFEVDQTKRVVTFIAFGHHDEIYNKKS